VYQLICCIFCCQLLCFYPQTAFAKRNRAKALKRYLTNMRKAGALFTRHTIKYDDLKTMLNRYKKRNSKPRYRRKRNVHINFAPHIGVDLPTNVVKCRIFCRSGLYLQLLPNGVVKGTANSLDKHIFLQIQSFGPSLVRIKGEHSSRYLTIDRKGRLKAMRRPKLDESLFKEIQEENSYNSYSSFKYFYDEPYDMFLGLRATGQIKKTWKAYPGQVATQFLVIKNQ